MIKLDVTVEEINVVLGALSKLPYEVSVELIQKLTKQAQGQLDNANQELPEEDEEVITVED